MTMRANVAKGGWGYDPGRREGESGRYWRVITVKDEAGEPVARMEVLRFRHYEPHRPYAWEWAEFAVTPWGDEDADPVRVEWRDGAWWFDGTEYPPRRGNKYGPAAEAALTR